MCRVSCWLRPQIAPTRPLFVLEVVWCSWQAQGGGGGASRHHHATIQRAVVPRMPLGQSYAGWAVLGGAPVCTQVCHFHLPNTPLWCLSVHFGGTTHGMPACADPPKSAQRPSILVRTSRRWSHVSVGAPVATGELPLTRVPTRVLLSTQTPPRDQYLSVRVPSSGQRAQTG